MDRRRFLALLGLGTAGAMTLDLDKLLWVPGKKTIFLPAKTVFGPDVLTNEWVVKEAAMLLDRFLCHNTRVERQKGRIYGPFKHGVFADQSYVDVLPPVAHMTSDQYSQRYLAPAMASLADHVRAYGADVFGELPIPHGVETGIRITNDRVSLRLLSDRGVFAEPVFRFDVLTGKAL